MRVDAVVVIQIAKSDRQTCSEVFFYLLLDVEESGVDLIVEVLGLPPGWFLSLYLAELNLQMLFHPLLPSRIADTAFQFYLLQCHRTWWYTSI